MNKSTKGFALLITITLLAFLVLLLVSLNSVTRVETSVADNGQALSKARENAMAGLNLAVGQLQKFAGPDRVVTARADITSSAALRQPYLTGIWKTTNTTSVPDVWLVSGNESSPVSNTPSNVLDPATGAEPVADGASGHVFLVGSNAVSANDRRVRLAKQPISAAAGTMPGLSTAATIGNFAYWVGDEGIKASAALVNPTLLPSAISYDNGTGSAGQGDDWTTDTAKRARLDQLQLARPRLEKLFTVGPFDPDSSGALDGLPRVSERRQLSLMVNSPSAAVLKQYFHAVTPISQAVLADVTNGRLRKDLSDTSVTPDATILAFQQTRLTNPATGFAATYTPVKASSATAATYPAYSLGPVLSEAGIRFNFYLSTADNRVHYAYVIDAEFWNPYAAELRLVAGSPVTVEISGLPAIKVTTDGATNVTFTPTATATLNAAATATWSAGQIRTFRGATALELVATPGAISDQVVPSAPLDASATTVTATYAAASALKVVVKVNGNELATYTPTVAFSAGSVSNGTASASTGWLMGYGYEFADNLETFTNGAAATSFDARLPVLNGSFNSSTSSVWSTTPDANIGGIGSAGTFSDNSVVVLNDLPRQEIVSLGMLTHVIGAKPYTVGSKWGGAANAIFDQYHVSTVPRFAAVWTAESGLPLPNRYTAIYHPEGVATIPAADMRSSDRSARYLLQNGAFNINSTSTEAWTAVLGSRFGGGNLWKYSVDPTTGLTLDNVFFRLPHGAQQMANPPVVNGGSSTDALTDVNAQKSGGRQLTDTEVSSLAAQIVTRLRTRARPFVSLQEFINSGLVSDAITAAGINSTLGVSKRYAPGALTQADVIGLIAPFMAVRSDTFVVRAYGDVQNPATGSVDGRAWCEAVVQRLPDLAGNSSASIADVISPSTATYPFGRKFKIVAFRWLTASDL